MTKPSTSPYTRTVDGNADDVLAGLLAQFDTLYAAQKEAADKLDALKAAIKAHVTNAYQTAAKAPHESYVLASADLAAPLRLTWATSTRFDTATFRVAYPDLAKAYSKTGSTWRMERSKS